MGATRSRSAAWRWLLALLLAIGPVGCTRHGLRNSAAQQSSNLSGLRLPGSPDARFGFSDTARQIERNVGY